MLERIPKEVDYIRFTDTRKIIHGDFSINQCHRLIDSLELNTKSSSSNHLIEEKIIINFEFGVDDFGHRFMSGTIKTTLGLTCQRCMKPMTYPINIDVAIAFMLEKDKENEDEILGLYEAFYCKDRYEPIDLFAYIEDEILLSLPLIPKHEEACISLDDYNNEIDKDFIEEVLVKKNPFDVLEKLKKH